MRFFDFLFPPRVDEAVLRDISADDFLTLITPRLVPQTRPDAVALLPFHDARVRSAIHEAKYHGNERAFRLLSNTLADYLRDCDDAGKKSRIVPVPLGKGRQKERGYNQVHEILLRTMHLLGKEAGIEIDTSLLVRTRETPSQVSLPRHTREENMRGAFTCLLAGRTQLDPAYTYIVVDDVLTTGATLQAAIDALKEAGATHIIPLALAH